jgi:hypothetical protein
MKPIGLMCRNDGELMVVHLCLNCGKVSYNRIAGDDNTYALFELLCDQDASTTTRHPALLTKEDSLQVRTALFGVS